MPVIQIVIVLLLILVNGALALSEMAMVSSRQARLEALAKGGSRGAGVALELLKDPSGFLAAVQIGITLVGIFAGAFSGATLAEPLGLLLDRLPWIAPNGDTVALAAVVVAVTYLSLVAGELVPKRMALANPERAAALVARPLRVLARIAHPAVWLLRHSTESVLNLLGLGSRRSATVTEDEVRSLIAEGTRAGIFEPQEREMIDGVLRLADRTVRAVMTPRAEVAWIDRGADRHILAETVAATRHTQLVVCDGSVDAAMGIVNTRDLLAATLAGETPDLGALTRPALFVPEGMSVLGLIDQFRRSRSRLALIVDEYGATQGIVSATDILESIAGALPEPGEEAVPMLTRRPDGSWLVDGRMPIDEFEEHAGIPGLRGSADFETVAGFVLDRLGHLPEVGDRVTRDGMTFEVVDMDGRRIDKVLVTPKPPADRQPD